MGGGLGGETMKWNKSNRHTLISFPSLAVSFFFPIFAIFPYLNEHHSFLWRAGAGVITSQGGHMQGEEDGGTGGTGGGD